jgi:alpha-1,2-mannosyltransferase
MEPITRASSPGIEQKTLCFVLMAALAMVLVNLAGVILRGLWPAFIPGPWFLTIGSVIFTAVLVWRVPGLSRRMPGWINGAWHSHRVASLTVIIVHLVMLVQLARLTVHTADHEEPWWILTTNEFWTQHECGTAYFHAVELIERGETNIYSPDHYPGLNREMTPHTDIAGMRVEDAYQYPPPFLLLPKLLLSITRDYSILRVIWFVLQFLVIGVALILLARFAGGATGRWMLLLSPLVLVAPATLYGFQYSQFHLMAIALAVIAMVLIERHHNALGGAILAGTVLGKIFPGFLLILLTVERRWKALGWALVFGSLWTGMAMLVFGIEPFVAFFQFHVPRLQSFAAFAFLDVWPEVRFELITANMSPLGQVMKFDEMGAPGMSMNLAILVNTMAVVALVPLTAYSATRMSDSITRARVWLAVLGLASLVSPAAWGDYVPMPALWLVTMYAVEAAASRKMAVVMVVNTLFFYFLFGLVPLGRFPSETTTYVLSTITFGLMVTLMGWTLVGNPASAVRRMNALLRKKSWTSPRPRIRKPVLFQRRSSCSPAPAISQYK